MQIHNWRAVMEKMPSARSLKQRWPDQYSAAIMIITPRGTQMLLETDLPEKLVGEILRKVRKHMGGPDVKQVANADSEDDDSDD